MPALFQFAGGMLAMSNKREKIVKDLMVSLNACRTIAAGSSLTEAAGLLKRVVLQSRAGAVQPLVVLDGLVPVGLLKVSHLLDLARLPQPGSDSYVGWSVSTGLEEPPSFCGLFTHRIQEMSGKKVGEVMRPFPVTLQPGDSLSRAAYLMSHYGFEILPVIKNGRVVGLLRDKELFLEMGRILAGG
ncbi:CBS domain-containing protein [Desulfofundulus thermobenzoicus]|uniref:CBS domain-containing protein n=1 Tax=Desulfofundulus thermobenzoicus TaxID=29376 RepID=A0A6N7IW35_9FIRM|nr:CBS domain-containing protein [Desulfofundulus thermobenzoicus]MQL53687.1 CBS domain-containing protein [Desulfofundulus thermobenzoicus]